MTLAVEFHSGPVASARAVYRKNEFALEYSVEPSLLRAGDDDLRSKVDKSLGIAVTKWFAVADTLVMVFSGPEGDLVAFDAYTNCDLWTPATELPRPNIIGVGRVCLASPPRDTDRIDLGVRPRFDFSPSQGTLLISYGRAGSKHYQVSSCLVVGMDDDGLASLQISNIAA